MRQKLLDNFFKQKFNITTLRFTNFQVENNPNDIIEVLEKFINLHDNKH
jgi:hypothetical protein